MTLRFSRPGVGSRHSVLPHQRLGAVMVVRIGRTDAVKGIADKFAQTVQYHVKKVVT